MVISSFLESKSTSPYSIPVRILKSLKHEVLIPISKLINQSFESGIFPNLLKTSKVVPVFKKKVLLLRSSYVEVSNYHPISILSNIEKTFEKEMYSRLMSFLDDQHLIYTRQFGFRKGPRHCELCPLYLYTH